MTTNPTTVPTLAGEGKTSTLIEARKAWAGQKVWVTARNRLIATETGRVAGAEAENALSTAALRERISQGQGPAAGDVLVVDELDLLHDADVEMIFGLTRNGVDVEAL